MRQAWFRIGDQLRKTTHDEMKRKKNGQVYMTHIGRGGKVLKRARRHQASAPGEAPAILTKRLFNSVGYKIHGATILEFGAGNESTRKYARRLELNMDRSYLGRSIQINERNTENYLEDEIRKELNRK